jgi:hypothetical protein
MYGRPSFMQVAVEVDAQSGTEVSVLSLGLTDSPPASSAGSWNPALVTTARSRQQQGLEPQVGICSWGHNPAKGVTACPPCSAARQQRKSSAQAQTCGVAPRSWKSCFMQGIYNARPSYGSAAELVAAQLPKSRPQASGARHYV